MIIIYSIVILIATFFGAIAGLGGGVIIKPLLDLIGYHDAATIGFYSALAVFTMSIVAITKQLKKGFKLDISRVIYVAIGSIIGGLIGQTIFSILTSSLSNTAITVIQSIILIILFLFILIFTLLKEQIKTYKIINPIVIFVMGLLLGTISVFLGIGGGPVNVAFLLLLFSLDIKQATVYSIAIIFFSQLTKLTTLVVTGAAFNFDLSFVPFICLSAIVGGFIGTHLNQKLTNKQISNIFVIMMFILIAISLFNIIKVTI